MNRHIRSRGPYVAAFSLCLLWLVAHCSPPSQGNGGGDGDADADSDIDADRDTPDADQNGDADAPDAPEVPDSDRSHDADPHQVDGTGQYDASNPDSSCGPPCETEVQPGCISEELCDNGTDDDCDLEVDEDCLCDPGAVQACFVGPPNFRGLGVCTDGHQVCRGMEFGYWGPCEGGISPSTEVCDLADNDCDGCVDDGLCCGGELDCPEPGDPRVPDTAPFSDYVLNGEDFYSGDAVSWQWEVHGPPCDRMRERTTNDARSYTLSGEDTSVLTINFTLSGDYVVTMRVTTPDQEVLECTFVVHVRGPGLRVELCWDRVGGMLRTDLDLHLHRPGSQTDWFGALEGETQVISNDDCYFCNCKATLFCDTAEGPPDWGYPDTDLANCSSGPAGNAWRRYGACRNPRLDIDNYTPFDGAKPENINLDNPADMDAFRVMVHFYSGMQETHPIVNIYCGGFLVGTYGDAPDELREFDGGGDQGWGVGQMWRAVDVLTHVAGDQVTCDLTPLRNPSDPTDYWVTTDDITY